jgi:polysaccharide biosynthesis/export protein
MKNKHLTLAGLSIRVIAFILLFTSCISQSRVKILQEKAQRDMSAPFNTSKKSVYKLQSGDHLYIKITSVDPKTSKFFQSDFPSLMNPTYLYLNSYTVDEEGYIHFSFVEKMLVKGLTIQEVRELVQKTISEYFKDATVYVKLVNFQVAVLGEVNTPGNFTIDKDQINIFQAVGLAGGFKDYANVKKVTLVRQTLNGSNVYYLDLSDNKILESDHFYLMPNDVVYVQAYDSKSFTFSQFPYQVLLSALTTALLFVTVLK